MKKEHIDIDRMVMESHYLNSLDRELTGSSMSDMEREGYLIEIRELKESKQEQTRLIKELLATIKELKDNLGRNMEIQKRQEDMLDSLRVEVSKLLQVLSDKDIRIVELENEVRTLTDRVRVRNKDLYGSKSQKRKVVPSEKKSREEEKDDWRNDKNNRDNAGSSSKDKVSGKEKQELRQERVKSEFLCDDRDKKRGPYKKMSAAVEVYHETTLEGIPEWMKFVKYKTIKEYTKKSYVQSDTFRVAVLEDEFGVRHEYYKSANAEDNSMPHEYVVPHTSCSPEFLAELVLSEHMLKVPNLREGIRMEADKFVSCSNTLKNWKHWGAKVLRPLLGLFKVRLLQEGTVVNIDETWTRIRIKFKGDGTKLGHYFKKYIWVLVNKINKVSYFFYDNEENDSRGHRPIAKFLGLASVDIQSDGYVVYKFLEGSTPGLHLLCWAHVRAKYKLALEISKDAEAEAFLNDIGYLYMVESECILKNMTYSEIKARRARRDVRMVLKRLERRGKRLMKGIKNGTYKCSKNMHDALAYMLNGWDKLRVYLKDGRYTIDNNIAERAIRPFTVYRKNMLHFGSEEGIEDTMTYLTVIETVKMWGYNVKDYLVRIFTDAIKGIKDYTIYDPARMAAMV